MSTPIGPLIQHAAQNAGIIQKPVHIDLILPSYDSTEIGSFRYVNCDGRTCPAKMLFPE